MVWRATRWVVDSHDRRRGLEVRIRPWSCQVDSGSELSVAQRPVGLGECGGLDGASAQPLCSSWWSSGS